jgi:copper chaperone NosL
MMRIGKRALTATLCAVCLAAVAVSASDPPRPGPRDRCAVCGMFVAEYPSWVAAIELEHGRRLFFDGPKDMFRFLLEPETYARGEDVDRDDVERIWVTDYYTTRMIDATTAFYVVGSDVTGPMGPELVPMATREAAESFTADHGGDRVLAFAEVTSDAVKH